MKSKNFMSQLGDYFDSYLPDVHNASPNTIAAYGDAFAIFFQFLHEKRGIAHTSVTYKHLTPDLFDGFISWMRNDRVYSDSSIRQRLTAISAFLKYASRRDVATIKPYTSITDAEKPSARRTEFSYFTVDEAQILFSLPDPKKYLGGRDYVLLSLLYDTAARAQEMCDLRVCDVKFGNPTRITLHGKGNNTRKVPISDEVSALLKYHFEKQKLKQGDKDAPLFLNQSGEKMTTATIRSIVKKYVNMARKTHPDMFQEPSYSPHSFRHSKAVHMVEAGVDIIYIRNFLGHASVLTTEIYARVGQEAVTKALTERKIPKPSSEVPADDKQSCDLPDFIKKAKKTSKQ